MGRGVSCGGWQSSLGYLFGSGEASNPAANNSSAPPDDGQAANGGKMPSRHAAPQPVDAIKQVPAGVNITPTNNYVRADGQNTGNSSRIGLRSRSMLHLVVIRPWITSLVVTISLDMIPYPYPLNMHHCTEPVTLTMTLLVFQS